MKFDANLMIKLRVSETSVKTKGKDKSSTDCFVSLAMTSSSLRRVRNERQSNLFSIAMRLCQPPARHANAIGFVWLRYNLGRTHPPDEGIAFFNYIYHTANLAYSSVPVLALRKI